uniref:Uncharacterized protein n=1 Tax=Mycena chlorophos TaxID=658473 RepID=A0ABQ0M7E3_MYCCL|nr:predicted protein [Mycena chlorophos]
MSQSRPTPSSPFDPPPAISSHSYPYSRSRAPTAASSSSSSVYTTPYLPSSPLSSAPATPPLATGRLSHPNIKQEQPDDDGFIVDASPSNSTRNSTALAHALACAPPTEVPLRATQASARMRRMMGVFRLNPFAIQLQKGQRPPSKTDCTWAGGEARPLDEPPRVFEFQLALEQPLLPEYGSDDEGGGGRLEEVEPATNEGNGGSGGLDFGAVSLDGLRAFSPEFELESEHEPSWELAYSAHSFDPTAAYPRALAYQSSPQKRSNYEASARRWSLPGHAHDPASVFLM